MSGPGDTVTMMDPHGGLHDVPLDKVADAEVAGFHRQTTGEETAQLAGEVETDPLKAHPIASKALAGGFAVARGATLGLSDVALRATGGQRFAEQLKEFSPTISTVGEIAGALATAIPTGGSSLLDALPGRAAVKLGARVAKGTEEASALMKVGRAALGGGTEGALFGAGQGVSDVALDPDVTIEHAVSTVGSRALYGAALGAGGGVAAKGAELALGRARAAMDGFAAARANAEGLPEDIAGMDVKQLRAARKDELAAIDAQHETDYARLEGERVPQRAQLADEIAAFRREVKEANHYLTTDEIALKAEGGKLGTSEIGKISKDANLQLDRLLRDPKGLAADPAIAAKTLRQQENAMEKLLEREPELRVAYQSSEREAERAAALDNVKVALEKNRALQARIAEVAPKPKLVKPTTSPRLEAIDTARELLANGGEKTVAEQMVHGSLYGAIHGVVASVPFVGPIAAPLVGAKAAKLITEGVFGGLGKASAGVATKAAGAISRFAEVGGKVTRAAQPVAPVLASKVLAAASFAPPAPGARRAKQAEPAKEPTLADHYMRVAGEIRSQVMPGPNGQPVMQPAARRAVADRLRPIAAVNPVLADRIETAAADRIAFLASKLVKQPDLPIGLTGPSLWRPSDLEMRTFARYVAAVHDPAGVIERLAHGTITPEDVETMRTLYPAMHAYVTAEVMQKLPTLQKQLPYARRVALSMFTGVPVDPAMHPAVLAILQGQFAAEEGSDGGMQAPAPAPAFGSVKKSIPQPTPAQTRAG